MIGVDERNLVRQGFENRFVRDLRARGQEAVYTHELMNLAEIKANKEAAASKLRRAGADSVLIIRLVDRATYDREVRATSEKYVGTITGMETVYGWYDYYTVAFMDMGTTWTSDRLALYLDSSLYDIETGKRIWSAQTETVLKDRTDRLAEADALCATVVNAMAKDNVIPSLNVSPR